MTTIQPTTQHITYLPTDGSAPTNGGLTPEKAGEIMEAVIAKGDLAALNPAERANYYTRVCESIGLNPLTKPFEYIVLNGKLTLYARKDATDQLRKRYGVSVIEMTEVAHEGLTVVTVKVRDAGGRTDMAKGAVSLVGLRGEALANAIMKAETKAKRRATLSICGLGFLDETEIETIPDARPEPTSPEPRVLKKDHRADYHAMLAELDNATDKADWEVDNTERIQALPLDWQKNIRAVIDVGLDNPDVSSGEILGDQWGDQQGQKLHTATKVRAPEPSGKENEVPTAKFYTEMWDSAIEVAKPEHRASLVKMWADERDIRRNIYWTEAHPCDPLISRVAARLKALKGEGP